MNQLKHYLNISTSLINITNLHIGGTEEAIKIGGIDRPVVRNPITGKPYIPGSTLKGRLRMALELKYKDYSSKGDPSEDEDNPSLVCKLFGNHNSKKSKGPTRLIIRDALLNKDYDDYIQGFEKKELKMDRIKMSGSSSGPRTQEFISSGAVFDFTATIRIFEGDDEQRFIERIKEAMKIVEQEYIGGSGTRGYGQVKFGELKLEKINI